MNVIAYQVALMLSAAWIVSSFAVLVGIFCMTRADERNRKRRLEDMARLQRAHQRREMRL